MALHAPAHPAAAPADTAMAPPTCPRCDTTMAPSQVERGSALRLPLKLWRCGNCGIRLPRFDDGS